MPRQSHESGPGLGGLCVLALAAGLYSLCHDDLYLVSPRHGLGVGDPYRVLASVGLLLAGSGFLSLKLILSAEGGSVGAETLANLSVWAGIFGVLLFLAALVLNYVVG